MDYYTSEELEEVELTEELGLLEELADIENQIDSLSRDFDLATRSGRNSVCAAIEQRIEELRSEQEFLENVLGI